MDTQSDTKEHERTAPIQDAVLKKRKVFSIKTSKNSEKAAAVPRNHKSTYQQEPILLATELTKANNDELFSDIDLMGFPGVTPCRTKEFAITAEGFIPLVEKEYNVITVYKSHFGKSVPKSAWVYYCVMFLYAHLVGLKQKDGESTYMEDCFMYQVLSGNHSLTSSIESYIKEHVTRNASTNYKLRVPAWPSMVGNFGLVGRDTHWMYMSMPCPEVCARRILEDLRFTAQRGERDWNLPHTLVALDEAAGDPVHRVLGYARAASLSTNQVIFLERANIYQDSFPTKYRQFFYSSDLFENISLSLSAFSSAEDKVKISPQVRHF